MNVVRQCDVVTAWRAYSAREMSRGNQAMRGGMRSRVRVCDAR